MLMVRVVKIFVLLLFIHNWNISKAQLVKLSNDSNKKLADSTTVYYTSKMPIKILTLSDSIVNFAYQFLGDRYRRGGTSSKGFDCSGYTMTVFHNFGIRIPHTSSGQGLIGVDVSKNNIKKGDLILFKGHSRRSKRIGHVGIVISEKGEPVKFIHSSISDGVRIDRLEFDYYKNRYVKTIRVSELLRN